MQKLYNQMSIINNCQIQECVKTWQNNTLFILFKLIEGNQQAWQWFVISRDLGYKISRVMRFS